MRLLFLLIFGVVSYATLSQNVVSGQVSDTDGKPVDNAIVKILDGTKLAGYAMTKADGTFSVKVKSVAEKLNLRVERLSYARYSRDIDNVTSEIKVVLTSQATELKEVTVSAPMVYVRGDTLTFRLAAFKGKGDITLKDAMKKILGIEIDDNGKIKYNGKAISKFYIEGIDLTDGKYNIATDNIPAEYVNAVQVLNNHKESKLDKDRFSDDVAINVKLEPWAKFKPMGNYELSAGYGDKALYRVGGAGMMFNKKFQTILTAKIGNVEEFSKKATYVLADRLKEKDGLQESVLGKLSASRPPLEATRYISPDDRSVTVNLVNKVKDDVQVKTNASYTYSKEQYDYATTGIYYDGSNEIVIDQQFAPMSREHRPELSTVYIINSDKTDLQNRFSAKASFFDASLPTLRDGNRLSQYEKMTTFGINDAFSVRWKRGKLMWGVRSSFTYNGGPVGHIDVGRMSGEGYASVQRARTSQFNTRQGISLTYNRLNTYLSLPVEVEYTSERIKTFLAHDVVGNSDNIVDGSDINIKVNPSFSYTHPRKILSLTASANLAARSFVYENTGTTAARQKSFRFTVNPHLYVNWSMNAKSSFTLSTSFNHAMGDILDMLTSPVALNNLNVRAKSGIISEAKQMSSILRYDFKMPVEMVFFNASVNHTATRRNLLTAQSVSDNVIGSYMVDRPAHGRNTVFSASVVKQFQRIAKFSLGALYSFGRQEMFQLDEVIPYDNRMFSIFPSVNIHPWKFVELDYNVNISKTFSSFADVKRSYLSQLHRGKLSFFIADGINVGIASSMSWHELSPEVSKFIALLDVDTGYTYKSWHFSFKVSNIFDARHYAYTVFSGLDSFTYDYRLRGREFLVSICFTK